MSPRQLPPTPSAEHLRKEAKKLLKAHRRGDPACCAVLRNLHHLTEAPDATILASKINLTAVQFALAMDYGSRTWGELMGEVGARSGEDPMGEPDGTEKRFSRARAMRSGKSIWLDPIPRYPYAARRVDAQGNTLRHERDAALHSKIGGNLYCAINMMGGAVSWPEVAAASGEAFRFAFEPRWAQDAEYLADYDAFARACETLGFSYQTSTGATREESLALIDAALAAGRPALVSGWGDRFWRVVVGVEPDANIYRCIGGVDFEGSIPQEDVRVGESLSLHIPREGCPLRPIPQDDWYGAIIGPEQVAVNAVFVVGERDEVPAAERIRRVLAHAVTQNEPTVIERINLEARKRAIPPEYEGHGGWQAFYSPWEGRFTMGSAGLRAWADRVMAMDAPDDDFEMVHGIDVTFGGYMACRAKDAVAWLRWAEDRVPDAAREPLRAARAAFVEIGRVTIEDLGLIRTVPCFVPSPVAEDTRADLLAMVNERPALIYLVNDDEREMLGERAASAKGSPWGWRLLPLPGPFEEGKAMVAAQLRRLADLRDGAFAAMDKALAAM